MRLYVTAWETYDKDHGIELNYLFTGTQSDQRGVERNVKEEGNTLIRSEPVEVPTDKAGLLDFLNKYRVREGLSHA